MKQGMIGRTHDLNQFERQKSLLFTSLTPVPSLFELSHNGIFNVVKELISCHDALCEASHILDIRCAFSLSLLQLGVWVALDLPDSPIDQIVALNIDPYLRFSTYFSTAAIPRE